MVVESVKESQGGFESDLGNVLSTGQWLSIPFILVGFILFLLRRRQVKYKLNYNNKK